MALAFSDRRWNARRRRSAAALALLLAALPGIAAQVSDARGRTIRLAQPAQRVVTLAPHLAELVTALGASDKLVAVSRFTDYPAALTKLPHIGDAAALDFERIHALQPDLILAWQSGNRADAVERLERLGHKVYVARQPRLADIAVELRALGALLGAPERGARAAREFDSGLSVLRARYAAARPVSVYLAIWHQPPITVSAAHWIDEIISLCGGRNIFAPARGLTPTVALESIYRHNPQVIVGGAFGGGAFSAAWRAHSALRAVRQQQVHYIDPDLLQRPTPRLLQGARRLCTVLDTARDVMIEEMRQ